MSAADPFAGIENSHVSTGGRYITPGRYRLSLEQMTMFDSAKRPGVQYFCVEATIVNTTSPDYNEGDRVTWLQDLTRQAAQGNILGLMLALNPKATKKDITSEVMHEMVGPKNPANGMVVDVNAYRAVAQTSGREYTRFSWSPPSGEWTFEKQPTVDHQAIADSASADSSEEIPF